MNYFDVSSKDNHFLRGTSHKEQVAVLDRCLRSGLNGLPIMWFISEFVHGGIVPYGASQEVFGVPGARCENDPDAYTITKQSLICLRIHGAREKHQVAFASNI